MYNYTPVKIWINAKRVVVIQYTLSLADLVILKGQEET